MDGYDARAKLQTERERERERCRSGWGWMVENFVVPPIILFAASVFEHFAYSILLLSNRHVHQHVRIGYSTLNSLL
jgi:hypothetical protein